MKQSIIYFLLTALCFYNNDVMSQKGKSTMKYIDRANMNENVKPGDNFYLYANGNWIKNNPLPASRSRWGSFDVLNQTSLERLKELAEESARNPSKNTFAQRVGDFYASAMDSSAIEQLGYTPIKDELLRLSSLTDKDKY